MPYADPERKKAWDRAYGNAHKEERLARGRAWAKANHERFRELQNNWARKAWAEGRSFDQQPENQVRVSIRKDEWARKNRKEI